MQYKDNWQEAKERFAAWWAHKCTDRPLLNLWTYREKPLREPAGPPEFTEDSEHYLNVGKLIGMAVDSFSVLEPLAEAMPSVSLNLGAGSMALYLGCEPNFRKESVWFERCLNGYDAGGTVIFNSENKWYSRHLAMYRQARALLEGSDIMLDVPDIVENLDIISSMRGPQQACYDLYDYPDEVKAAIWKINEYYKTCYDAFNGICHGGDGESSFTAFAIWGMGRTAKVQCDHSAMISPGQFREFVQEPLREQCRWLDNSLYHLDGPDCLCHVKALMEIDELDALQWTTGDGNPPAGEDCWDGLYRQVKDAGKGIWVGLGDYTPDVAMDKADRLVRKHGADGFYFLFPPMDQSNARALLRKAEREWKC